MEQVRSEDMIEIIQNDLQEKRENSPNQKRLNNIRQIGNPEGKIRIYLEDYVYTYLHQTPERGEECIGILLGQTQIEDDRMNLFISGAIGLYSDKELNERVFFQEETWDKLYRIMKEYFDDLEVMGWYQIQLREQVALTDEMERVRRKYFDGNGKVMFLVDFLENEEAFYVYDGSSIIRKGGYYIYYERNPQMQEYMVQVREPKHRVEKEMLPEPRRVVGRDNRKLVNHSVESHGQDNLKQQPEQEVGRRAAHLQSEDIVENYRSLLRQKKVQQSPPQGRWHGMIYAMSGALVFAVALMAVTTLNSVEQIQKVENTLAVMAQSGLVGKTEESDDATNSEAEGQQKESAQVEDADTSADSQSEGIVVETIAGNVEPEADSEGDSEGETGSDSEGDSEGEAGSDSEAGSEGETGSDSEEDSEGDSKADSDSKKDSADDSKSDGGENQGSAEKEANRSTTAKDQAAVWISQGYYDVQKGDSLDKICQKIYNTTAIKQQICDLNGITDEDKLNAGQRLKLP